MFGLMGAWQLLILSICYFTHTAAFLQPLPVKYYRPITKPNSALNTARPSSMNFSGKEGSQQNGINKLDKAIFATYFCTAFAVTLPVDLMPMIAGEQAASAGSGFVIAAFVAATASISTFCGGLGKLINGFICQGLGGRFSSSLYLIGMSLSLVLLSLNEQISNFGYILGGLEFCSSMQWTACSLILANHYSQDPAKFAASIATLTLASTCGTLTAKAGGTALLHIFNDWRVVARIGASAALAGSLIVRSLTSEHPNDANGKKNVKEENKLSMNAVKLSIKSVLGSRIFWLAGLAHATALMTRSADRVLGSFVLEATNLPRKFCGGLTASMTVGFLLGLSNTRKFYDKPDIKSKTRFLGRKYFGAFLSVLGLALCGNQNIVNTFIPSKKILAGIIALLAGSMSYNLSFQVYQIPPMVASTLFEENKAVCLSLLDAFGFFLASPVWAGTSCLISGMGHNGWMATWTLLATLFAIGGSIMVKVMPKILLKQAEKGRLN